MTKGKNNKPAVLLILASVFLASCGDKVVYNTSERMPGNLWSLSHVPVFAVEVADTVNSHDLSFSIRTGSAYPFRNLYLFVTATSPEGRTMTDTLHYNLADEKGRRYGNGFGDIRELKLPYRTNVFFPLKGTYSVRVQHGMRADELPGVYDLSLRVERSSKK
ncbi:MAG: gliding motility lipoprotein GldH [Bacteroidales bacterium]|nr:gliding motility lipoprotein GldH [Bacteroidales bacterium]MCU0407893.1 gliding motility lipoprotein GldH [Bacteroidales bacterium]